MVHLSAPTISTDGECLICGGFSLGETICFWEPLVHHRLLRWHESLSQEERLRHLLHGLNPRWATIPSVAHDRGLHRGVLHGFKQEGAPASALPRGMAQGSACSHRNHTMARGRSGHSGHDNCSTVGTSTMAGHRPPLRVVACFLAGAMLLGIPRPVPCSTKSRNGPPTSSPHPGYGTQ
jgi:hypothetical protein